jgi:hypothetical protein
MSDIIARITARSYMYDELDKARAEIVSKMLEIDPATWSLLDDEDQKIFLAGVIYPCSSKEELETRLRTIGVIYAELEWSKKLPQQDQKSVLVANGSKIVHRILGGYITKDGHFVTIGFVGTSR